MLMPRRVWEAVRFADVTRGEDTRFIQDCQAAGLLTYATDRFNHVYVRHTDHTRHTYQPHDLYLLAQTRIASFGNCLDHAFV